LLGDALGGRHHAFAGRQKVCLGEHAGLGYPKPASWRGTKHELLCVQMGQFAAERQ